jgi:GNAT superfamily N-acetyltransferase
VEGPALLNSRVDIERIDPRDLDLDTAEEMAALGNLTNEADGVRFPATTGPGTLKLLQLQSEGRPVDGVWVARDDDGRMVGRAAVALPHRQNTDSAWLRGAVLPEARRRGVGRALLEEALTVAAAGGRTKVYTGTFEGSPGDVALPALGFVPLGSVDAVRRIELELDSGARWQRVYDDALGHAADYELLRVVGPTPPEMLEDLVVLHDAINDAPLDDPDMDGDVWGTDRVVAYDRAMAGRSQTVYRVLARHRASGEWAGMSLLCVDEFAPAVAIQEDTSVVRKHRGHRLGLLMKADMLRWITRERPEVTATITWNATTNHHMIAVNELLGATVVARNANYRRDLG